MQYLLKIKNTSKKTKLVGAFVVCVFLILIAYIYIVHNGGEYRTLFGIVNRANNPDAVHQAPYVVPSLTKVYANSTYGFSLKIPEDFSTRESNMNSSHTIVFENTKGEGIQIVISPYDVKGVKVLTKDMIQSAILDMKITDDQVLDVGASYRGVAFKSDNDAFNGDSREVWFIFKDNLYQISTYSRFDELLKAMFATWEFK